MPFVSGTFTHPVEGKQPSKVHVLESSQESGAPGRQSPLMQVSAPLHLFVSAHGVPSVTGTFWQPVAGSHVSAVHGAPSSQFSVCALVHLPA